MIFGNGASLGEADRLYFAAGPEDETAGVFGSLSAVPGPGALGLAAGLVGLVLARLARRRPLAARGAVEGAGRRSGSNDALMQSATMKHADRVIQRILFLDGVPNLSDYDLIAVGATVRDQLANDLSLERAALGVLRPGVALCLDARDHASRDLLEHILRDEEDHVDWIEAQQHKIGEVGYQGYPAQQIYERS